MVPGNYYITVYNTESGANNFAAQFEIAYGDKNEDGVIEIVAIDKNYYRPLEVDTLLGNSSKARKELKWKIAYTLKSMIKEMVNEELYSLNNDKKIR